MIVKANLSPVRVLQYVARPLAWVVTWAVAAPAMYALTDDERLVIPFAPVAAIGAALAIFIAFRNNTAFARWNEARSAWQQVLVASRVLARQVVAATDNAVGTGTASADDATAYARELVLRLVAFSKLLAGRVRPSTDWDAVAVLVPPDELAALQASVNPPNLALTRLGVRVKDGIRAGLLGQFDPISLEPQLGALHAAQGVIERIKHTPTPRQYGYFTRRFVQLFALLAPFAIVGLVPDAVWWTVPLAVAVSGVFVVMAVTGSANDDPFADRVTDVPVLAICNELERDLREQLGDRELPAAVVAVDGYLW